MLTTSILFVLRFWKYYISCHLCDIYGDCIILCMCIFRLLDERRLHGLVKFAVSVTEVYNNDIFDLLTYEGKREKHEIVTSGEGNKDVPTLHHM